MLTRKIESVFLSKLSKEDIQLSKPIVLPKVAIFGGDFKFNNAEITVALFDVNEDGIFNTIDVDYLLIGPRGATQLYEHQSVQTKVIRPFIYIEHQKLLFRVINISPQGKFIELEQCDRSAVKTGSPVLKIFDKIPDQKFELLTGESSNLRDYVGQGKLIYIDIWGTWCPGCIQEIDELKGLHKKYKTRLTIISLNHKDNDRNRVIRFVKNNGIEWVNGFSTEAINLEIMQAAYPYGALFDEKGQLIKSDFSASGLSAYLKATVKDGEAN
jgi:thiol-disulfide isomerase/thioredoxin